MRFTALLAALALLGACGVAPEPDNRPRIEAIQPGHFTSQRMFEVKQVDAGSSYLKRLVEDVPLDQLRDITSEREVWQAHGQPRRSDVFLTAPDRATLEAFVRSEARLDVPVGREVAYGELDDGRWRTYLVVDDGALDGTSIATAMLSRDAAGQVKGDLVFTPKGRAQMHDLSARALGGKVALLVGHDVVWAPVIGTVIDGPRAELTFAGT